MRRGGFALVGLSSFLLFQASAALGAQAPLLAVAAVQDQHGWEARLTNRYSAAVTAYVMVMQYSRPGGGQSEAVRSAESIPGDLVRIGLGPNATVVTRMGSSAMTAVTYRVTAVIYADGQTAGDPAVLAHLLHTRKAELADAEGVLGILQGVAGGASSTRADLVQQFRLRVAAHRPALAADGLRMPNQDFVCQSVLASLEDPSKAGVSVQTQAGRLAALVERWIAQIRASRPDPESVPEG